MVIRLPYSGWTPLPSQLQREYHLPIDLSDGEVKPFISDDAFLGFSFHSLIFSSFESHFKATLGSRWAHTCSSVTFSLKDQQHLRLWTEWNNRLKNQQQSAHILRLWWRLSLLSPFWRLATFRPIWIGSNAAREGIGHWPRCRRCQDRHLLRGLIGPERGVTKPPNLMQQWNNS